MKLIKEKDARLSEISEAINIEDIPAHKELIENLITLMHNYRGKGIAAPQVGRNIRLFILEQGSENKVCFNPEILGKSEKEEIMSEGCITFPGLFLKVKRNVWVDVKYLNEKGNIIEERLSDIDAQCFQHELDHLNGIIFSERVSSFSFNFAMKKRNKVMKRVMRRIKNRANTA